MLSQIKEQLDHVLFGEEIHAVKKHEDEVIK